jgi:hypothetical protein
MSVIRADDVAPSAGGTTRKLVRGTAAAWANLNGTGTIALRDSENVSSVVDNGVGGYTFNYSNAMTNANYIINGTTSGDATAASYIFESNDAGNRSSATASSIRLNVVNSSAVEVDRFSVNVGVHGDLA